MKLLVSEEAIKEENTNFCVMSDFPPPPSACQKRGLGGAYPAACWRLWENLWDSWRARSLAFLSENNNTGPWSCAYEHWERKTIISVRVYPSVPAKLNISPRVGVILCSSSFFLAWIALGWYFWDSRELCYSVLVLIRCIVLLFIVIFMTVFQVLFRQLLENDWQLEYFWNQLNHSLEHAFCG